MSQNKMVNKLIGYLVLVAIVIVLVCVILFNQSQHKLTKKSLADEIIRSTSLEIQITNAAALRKKEDVARAEYIKNLKAAENEIELLRDDLADKRKRLSIRASCSGVPKADSAGGVEATTATLDPIAERAYLRHKERIADVEAWIGFCFKTVNACGL
jgi:prophage endopeptidase